MKKSINFFIATDVHLGHKQNQPVRKNDSFNAFQQVLSISTQQNADFLLLGGDLFDQVNPTQKSIYKCLDILQNYVQGQGKKDLNAYWKDHPDFKFNFSNQNMNIKLPIFTIHGNHDYPSNDFGKISICDLLHVSNYANYFGKHTSLAQITIKPMIIQKKGMKMKIALYGLGYIKDHVLNELFQKDKVKFQILQNKEEYFCLFIFHQNRYKKGLRAGAPALKCISSKNIPQWMDLTIWGHEHQAISNIDIEDDRKIFQPGSTVITSFIEAESYLKQCLHMEIFDNGEININPVPLTKSYRPMICRNYQIQDLALNHNKSNSIEFDIYAFLDNQLIQIINSTEHQFPNKKPIIRFKIQYTGFQISRCKMLQLKYIQKVANPESIFTFWKRKQIKPKTDQQLFKAFKQKKYLETQNKDITQQIIIKYIKSQQNRPLYYDPKQIYKFHLSSLQNEEKNQKEYSINCFKKQIEKRGNPTVKQIQNIYKISMKKINCILANEISKLTKSLQLDYQSSQQEDKQSIRPDPRNTWEDQKKILLLQQNNIQSINLLQNYKTNFIDSQSVSNAKKLNQNILIKQQSVKKQQKQKKQRDSSRSTASIPPQWINPQLQKKTKFIKMEIQSPVQNKKQRQGILKKSYIDSFDQQEKEHHQHDEEDCCKKAQKTQYDEGRTKNNFSDAHNMVKNNNNKKVKKNIKVKDQPKIMEKNKKSVKWSDSDDYD